MGPAAARPRPRLLLLPLLGLLTCPRSTGYMTTTATESQDDLYTTRCSATHYKWPRCVDHPDGYGCECGPAFYWNSRICVASGLDSRFEFSSRQQARYVTLMSKAFPEMEAFTIAAWVRLYPRQEGEGRAGILLSYTQGDVPDLVQINTWPTITLKIHGEILTTDYALNTTQWVHLAWTWTSNEGWWRLYVNGGSLVMKGRASGADRPVPAGGELVLGQASRSSQTHFDTEYAFLGDVAFVNVWRHAMHRKEVQAVYADCQMMQCGSALEWSDFRTGTRGSLKIRWPAGVYENDGACFSEQNAGATCDRYCSHTIGAQCNAEVVENILWPRTPAQHNATVPCPGENSVHDSNRTAMGYRECVRSSQYEGFWTAPILDDCLSPRLIDLRNSIQRSLISTSLINGSDIPDMTRRLLNITSHDTFRSPVEVAVALDMLRILVIAQRTMVDLVSVQHGSKAFAFGLIRKLDRMKYPSYAASKKFIQLVLGVVDAMTSERHDAAWLACNPQGGEGDQLMHTLDLFFDVVARSIRSHVTRGDTLTQNTAEFSALLGRVAFQTKIYHVSELGRVVFRAPGVDPAPAQSSMYATRDAIIDMNATDLPDFITLTLASFNMPKTLPHHNITARSKAETINTAFIYIKRHEDITQQSDNESTVHVHLDYLDNFNISNPKCVLLRPGNGSIKWRWSRDGGRLQLNTSRGAECTFNSLGLYAVLTDMYNIHWDPGEKPMILMAVPSYLGCSLSALLSLASSCLLVYFRTASKTAAIHKHFAVSIVCSQLTFMLGIDRLQNMVMCHVFAIAIHYFFLSTFMWLMNEAFNLYIVITYAAHSHGEHTEGGSQWRYYILGWVLPGVLVGAFVGAHMDDYYAPDMCWIAWQYVWLFLGPVVGIISVTILVLVFTAKEQHESSYSKNERTNRMIILYSKAVWTQTILLTICWSFAFLSIRMRGIIIKCLYALFNGLQGAFFFVFYFLLNDEVRAVLEARVKKKSLVKQGYEYTPTGSMDDDHDQISLHDLEDIDADEIIDETIELAEPEASTAGTSKQLRMRTRPRGRHKPNIEMSTDEEEEDSDCDMMVTAV